MSPAPAAPSPMPAFAPGDRLVAAAAAVAEDVDVDVVAAPANIELTEADAVAEVLSTSAANSNIPLATIPLTQTQLIIMTTIARQRGVTRPDILPAIRLIYHQHQHLNCHHTQDWLLVRRTRRTKQPNTPCNSHPGRKVYSTARCNCMNGHPGSRSASRWRGYSCRGRGGWRCMLRWTGSRCWCLDRGGGVVYGVGAVAVVAGCCCFGCHFGIWCVGGGERGSRRL